ncbi:galactose ABC transporter substrate-binding protein [Inconstantimicrobium mannanitabidum]|uniref:D-galactose-binding periplasmic protein n=1 Tax=Inconstantimicrobium mannanitabidum TaxID=1604901 RepID=A0ACB5RBL8_9CLOT|nr:galactose ABC transporter substrate-binding protein [Clostridium sp. TW13]GKX66637.1 D-galactose-binding periplasmic protein [Clostridium sp. TW13]
MRRVKRFLAFSIVIFMVSNMKIKYNNVISVASFRRGPIKVAVFLLDFTDDFISEIRASLEDIQKQNPGKIEYTFYDGKSNQAVQDASIDKVLKEGTDLILLNIVNREHAQSVINEIKEVNIPVILFNREPLTPLPIQSYSRALYIGTDQKGAGILQGKMLTDVWNSSKKYIDKNNDNVMQYVMLQGENNNTEAIDRTRYSVSSIEGSDIKTQQIALKICNWLEEPAYEAVKALLSKYGNQIEVIISNDDTMAIGAIKALQDYGYNEGDKFKTVPVVGVDVTIQAKELINKGYMLGSVYQKPREYADALYVCGMNLIERRIPTYGTKYELDDTKVSIRIALTDYYYKNMYL